MDNLIGKKLDGLYEVRELIGSGGMANVYKAVMLGHNGPVPAGTVVAVKVLRQEYMHDPDLVRRFKNESKAISLLNHPNIVKVYDVSVNDDLQYIVMEYVDGMTLREYLNQRGGRLTNRETVHFISQILKALEHAHANGVVHRDIKPQNIMLLDNGQLRMMDFGIARISRAENQLLSGKAMGSVHYISPEQAKGDETDCTSDIYSVGVMMYEMLSGHLPFDADDMVEVAIKQISDQPKSLHEIAPEVPNALVEITEKAMAKLPQNRYASAREMLDALDAYVHNPSVMFEYKYITEDAPEKVVKRTMNQNRANRQAEKPAPRGKKAAPRKKKRTIFLPALFGVTIAFALACLALCWMILNDSSNLMNNKADITLGDYIGMTQDEAAATEQVVSGQISVTWEQEYNSNYAAGYIYKQSPVSGRTVREGQNVTLTVSLGTQYVTVPDLTNYVQADAEQQLKELGVSVLVTQAVDTSVASGAVIRTDPAAGSQVAAGSTVVMYISRPQVATTTKVPSLTGMSTADARTLLVQNHLGLGSQTEQYSDQPVGTVISQDPAAGSTTKLNGRVNIVVSAGPEPAPEPEAPSDSTTGGDWWSGLFGSGSSSSSTETGAAVIAEIAPRKNVFVRPPVANLDVLFLVASTTQPTPSTLVLDKLAAIAVDKGVQPVIVCTKGDLAEAEFLRKAYEKSTLPFIRIDYETGGGLDEVKQWISGRLCAFCGNSGVGKSTLLNHLLPEAERETSAISQKLGRGRHTTREVTIFEAFGGRIADTPGFASLEANRAGFIPKENLEHAFPEFGPYLGQCQFTGCSHRSEKGCAVRAALAEGRLSQTRYDSYCAMYEEVKDVKDWQRPKV